jgi:hypothetical protein
MSVFTKLKRTAQPSYASRYPLRCAVRKARRGCIANFQKVVEHFTDFVVEYLALSGYHNRRGLQEAERIFSRIWTQMPLANRVSDVEHLLWLQLSRIPVRYELYPVDEAHAPIWMKYIRELNNEQRFLLVAREMEGWPLYWLALATRNRQADLEDKLFTIRASLLKDVLPLVSPQMQSAWKECSTDLDRRKDLTKDCRKLEQASSCTPEVRVFKTAWLERRCELIELRQNNRLTDNGRSLFLHQLTTRVATRERMRPALKARLINSIHFAALPDPDHV